MHVCAAVNGLCLIIKICDTKEEPVNHSDLILCSPDHLLSKKQKTHLVIMKLNL